MVTETKPSQPAKATPKVVPEADLIAYKKSSQERERKLREDLVKAQGQITRLQSEVKIAKVDVDDDEEVKKVRQLLMDEKQELDEERAKYEDEVIAFKSREKAVRVKELAMEKGLDPEILAKEEDVESASLRLYAERLAKENEDLKKKIVSPESVHETGVGVGLSKLEPKDMDEKQFQQYLQNLKKTTPAK